MKEKEVRDPENSRPLDVHRWSDHPEVNDFVDTIYLTIFKEGGKAAIQKKHVKVLLLDLYVAWCDDPGMSIRINRSPNEYLARSRYNSLHISRLTITVVDLLLEARLIEQLKGFNDKETGVGKLTRIWPAPDLVNMFANAKFGPFDIGQHQYRETVILRDEDGKEIEYRDNPQITVPMRQLLRRYNDMLSRTFIDIPELDSPVIEITNADEKRKSRLCVSQSQKLVRRVFNRGDQSFSKGGRFYGGWWQQCPKEWRKRIFIDDVPTNEIDYSGLHIVLLYAKRGIDYWKEIGTDPYALSKPEFLESDEQARDYAKQLFLVTINATSEGSAFQAFRSEAPIGSRAKSLTTSHLAMMLDAIRKKHAPIADDLSSDAGIDLMYLDSRITEHIIDRSLCRGIPVLTIHDSYIVPFGEEDFLEAAMMEAVEAHTGIANVKVNPLKTTFSDEFNWKQSVHDFSVKSQRALLWLVPKIILRKAKWADIQRPTHRSDGYSHRLAQFQEWRRKEEVTQRSRINENRPN